MGTGGNGRRIGVTLVGVALACAVLSASALVTAGVGAAATAAQSAQRSGCTSTITRPADAPPALNSAAPGDTLCFVGSGLTATDITMTRSGTAEAPIRLVADGATVRQVRITADHVVLRGFTVAGGSEMLLQGTGITVRDNTVRDTQRGGIVCQPCTDSTIVANTVQRAATIGIHLSGQRIIASANTVLGTVPRDDGDADGLRFFGNGHRISGNTIRDISAEGYADPPHPDCFQTFDNNRPPTFDIVISGNICHNVDAQCLIATGDERGNSDAPAGVASIVFTGNTCSVNGAQAVNLRHWPNVDLRTNRLSGPNLRRGILIVEGSTGCTAIRNTTSGGVATVEIDASSRPGFRAEGNRPA